MDLLQPLLLASMINEGVTKGDLSHIQLTGVYMAITSVFGLVGGVGCTIYASIASQSFGADLRADLYRHVQKLSFRNIDQLETGSLITRLTNDIQQLQNFVLMTLRIVVRAPFLSLGSFIMAFWMNPRLGMILLIAIPVLIVVMFTLIRYTFPFFRQVQQRMDRVNTVLQESLAGIRVVKAFVRADHENKRFGTANRELTDTSLRAARAVALNMPVTSMVLNGSIVAVLWFGGHQHWNGTMPLGDLIAFINYVTQMLFSLLMVSMILMNFSRAKVSADRVEEVLNTEPDIRNAPEPRTAAIREGRVEFRGVSFSYHGSGGKSVLSDITFTAEPGQTVAILGATGSGKSTLVQLIPRLYDPTAGQIRIDGVEIRELDLEHLRSRVSVVLQQTILFSGTIRDNLCFGRPDATREEMEAAAKAAEAHDFITSFADGYETVIGQRGVTLSGGQKQRIAIARSLLTKPAVLILDDSTSAVDLRTEARIQRALRELTQRSTCILIAQRISSVMDADQILVLEEGRLVAKGTHRELMAGSEVYRDIYRSQLGSGEEDAAYG